MTYSCARWIGLRVWKPATRFQPRRENSARVADGSSARSGNGASGRSKTVHAARQVRGRLRVDARDARVGLLGRAEAQLGLAAAVVAERLGDVEHGHGGAVLVDQRDAIAARRGLDGQRHGQRPERAVGEAHLLDHAVVVRLAHEALERRERARGDHVEVGDLLGAERHALERVQVGRALPGAVDEGAAMGGDEVAHARTSTGMSPRSSR